MHSGRLTKMKSIILDENFSKSFKDIKLFKDINLCIKKGDVLLIHGDNGVGKSTLLKIIVGIIDNDNKYNQYEPKDCKYEIGYSSSNNNSFFNRLTAKENLVFFMMLRGLSRKVAIKNIEKLVNKFEINKNILNKKYMLLSSGQKQISILRCLGHSPQLAILDEPFDNIDKSFKLKLEDFISQESKKCYGFCNCISCQQKPNKIYSININIK